MKIVFMGTPEFAVPCLQALIDSDIEISAVFTQTDKPKGRGYKLTPPPVKELAMKYNIPVYQPKSLKSGEDAEKSFAVLKKINPDLIIVVAYGKILPKDVLDIPKYCINVHGSLLPKYRGAGPIQWSIINGEKETGITTMIMAEGIDTGDMLIAENVKIGENETYSELHDRLSLIGAKVLMETLEEVKKGTLKRVKQDDSLSCYAPMISKEMCLVDFNDSAENVHHKICGLSAFPCAYTFLDGKKLKIYKSAVSSEKSDNKAGTVINEKNFTVVCGDKNCVTFTEVQLEGKKRMSTNDFLRGCKLEKGIILGV